MRNRALTSMFFMNADKSQFGLLKISLANAMSLGNDNYPITLEAAYQTLLTYTDPNSTQDKFERHGTKIAVAGEEDATQKNAEEDKRAGVTADKEDAAAGADPPEAMLSRK
jgi:hypothetical protein